MTFDLNSMELDELRKLQKDVANAIADYEQRKLKEAKLAVEAKLKEYGFQLEDLVGTQKTKKTRTPVEPKYAHPENPELTWSGRGRRPAWVLEHLDAGKDINDLLIK